MLLSFRKIHIVEIRSFSLQPSGILPPNRYIVRILKICFKPHMYHLHKNSDLIFLTNFV